MADLTPDALAAYTARYCETHTENLLLHEPSMRAVVDMVLERAIKAIRDEQPPVRGRPTERDIGYSGGLFAAEVVIAKLKGPRP